jgi:uncharacterized integral membrane protein
MMILILLLVIGGFLAYLSHDNLIPVSLRLGPYIFSDVPLFYVILGSIIVGLVVAYLINLIPAISQFFQLQGKENEIKKNKNKVLELTKRIHQLELENEKLKHKPDTGSSDSNAL